MYNILTAMSKHSTFGRTEDTDNENRGEDADNVPNGHNDL